MCSEPDMNKILLKTDSSSEVIARCLCNFIPEHQHWEGLQKVALLGRGSRDLIRALTPSKSWRMRRRIFCFALLISQGSCSRLSPCCPQLISPVPRGCRRLPAGYSPSERAGSARGACRVALVSRDVSSASWKRGPSFP